VGQEIETTLRWDGRIIEGKALLETDSLIFRGGASVTVPFAEMWSVEANAGWLELKTARGLLLLELGAKAETWKEKIKNPKGLVEKLGIDATKKIAVLGKLDAGLRGDLAATGAKIAKSARTKGGFDVVFVAVSSRKDLESVAKARELVTDAGAVWIVYPKGTEDPRERDVLTAGRTLQLTDNKQVKVDEALTAVRFVVPVAARRKK
jgi:hypothetical protein